jgi:hypothetical protein
VQTALTEARMVLPGIQSLFGFQMIAVFNERFDTSLDRTDQAVHYAALLLVAVAIGLVMAPAAYHREVHRQEVTAGLLRLTSRFIAWAMAPLAAGLAMDLYVVTRLAFDTDRSVAAGVGVAAFGVLAGLWFAFPSWARAHRRAAGAP